MNQPCSDGEGQATLLAGRFEQLGFTTVLDDSGTEKGRPNMYATLRNPSSSRWCGFDVHTDTVAITGMPSPFGGELNSRVSSSEYLEG